MVRRRIAGAAAGVINISTFFHHIFLDFEFLIVKFCMFPLQTSQMSSEQPDAEARAVTRMVLRPDLLALIQAKLFHWNIGRSQVCPNYLHKSGDSGRFQFRVPALEACCLAGGICPGLAPIAIASVTVHLLSEIIVCTVQMQ